MAATSPAAGSNEDAAVDESDNRDSSLSGSASRDSTMDQLLADFVAMFGAVSTARGHQNIITDLRAGNPAAADAARQWIKTRRRAGGDRDTDGAVERRPSPFAKTPKRTDSSEKLRNELTTTTNSSTRFSTSIPDLSIKGSLRSFAGRKSGLSRRLKAEHRRSRLLLMLKSPTTVHELAERLNVSPRTIDNDLRPLVNAGEVHKRGRTGRGGHVEYFIATDVDSSRT